MPTDPKKVPDRRGFGPEEPHAPADLRAEVQDMVDRAVRGEPISAAQLEHLRLRLEYQRLRRAAARCPVDDLTAMRERRRTY